MPTQLFEGKSLDEVLNRVTAELGESAEILDAQKVRKGGIAGFFSEEWYEIRAQASAELMQDQLRRESATDTMTSVLQLAEAVNQREKESPIDLRSPVSAKNAGSASTDSAEVSFAQALRDARIEMDQIGTDDLEISVDNETEEPFEPIVAAELPTVSIARSTHPEESPNGSPEGSPQGGSPQGGSPQGLDVDPSSPQGLDVDPSSTSNPGGPGCAVSNKLLRLGVPRSLVTMGADEDVLREFESRMRRLPTTPALAATKGSVVVVIGEADRVDKHANALATKLRRSPTEVVVFTRDPQRESAVSNILHSAEDAAAAKRSWKRRTKPTVVVIETDMMADSMIWAESLLTALEPTSTLAVVDARQKTEDIENWIESLGGVEALLVDNIRNTSTPAAVLSLGIPVTRIDGQRATAALWTAIVLDFMGD